MLATVYCIFQQVFGTDSDGKLDEWINLFLVDIRSHILCLNNAYYSIADVISRFNQLFVENLYTTIIQKVAPNQMQQAINQMRSNRFMFSQSLSNAPYLIRPEQLELPEEDRYYFKPQINHGKEFKNVPGHSVELNKSAFPLPFQHILFKGRKNVSLDDVIDFRTDNGKYRSFQIKKKKNV